jgi:[ribosomal protein S5]-alanine N-acetyltransferase
MFAEPNSMISGGACLSGRQTQLAAFSERHLHDPDYLRWLRDTEIVRTLNLPRYIETPVPFEEVSNYVKALMQSETDLFFAIQLLDPDIFIGTAKAGHIDWYSKTADIGIMIGRKDVWGRGLASDALSVLCEHLFESVGLRRLTAGVMATNPAMVRVFEKLGFSREGVFRQQDRLGDDYIDHIHLGCLKPEFSKA